MSSWLFLWGLDVQKGLGLVLTSLGVPLGILALLLGARIMKNCCSHCCGNMFFRIRLFEMFVSSLELL